MEGVYYLSSDWIYGNRSLPLESLRIDAQATMGQIRCLDSDFQSQLAIKIFNRPPMRRPAALVWEDPGVLAILLIAIQGVSTMSWAVNIWWRHQRM